VLTPERFDVIVASNLFGDILSDLAAAVAGSIGIAPSANIDPTGANPSLFEPVHGSAPDIAGQGIANPLGQVWTGALMLRHLGFAAAADRLEAAVAAVIAAGELTPDMGGSLSTTGVGERLVARLEALPV
jgi:tartrate dehydrogenase/decarboxylase / D-malate dehydrogenase